MITPKGLIPYSKKCNVRLSRELTRAAYQVLERGFKDIKRKKRLLTHVAEAGEVVPDLPDLAALDLPLIEDSDTKISLVLEKLEETQVNDGHDDKNKLKAKQEKQASRQSEEQISKSSINRKSNRLNSAGKLEGIGESRSKSIPRSTYGPGSDYLKFGGIDVHCKQPIEGVKRPSYETNRSAVERRMAGSSKLTNVYGESSSSTCPKDSTARTDFFKNRKTARPIRVGNSYGKQMEEPIIIESSRRSNNVRPNSKKEPGDINPDSMDGMQVLFQHNTSMQQPKNKFPAVWDTCDSDDSDAAVLEGSWRLQPLARSPQSRLAYPKDSSTSPKSSSHDLDMKGLHKKPENSQRTSKHEDTWVSRNLKKESALSAPKRMPVSFSARTSLAPVQEFRSPFGRNASEFSTRNKSKIKTPTQTADTDVLKLKPRTADVSRTRFLNSRTSSKTSSKSAASSSTRVTKSKTPSTTPRPSTSGVPSGRTASSALTKSRLEFKSLLSSATPSAASGSVTRDGKSKIPVATSKLTAKLTSSAVKSKTPSKTSRTTVDSNTQLIKSRQASKVSTRLKSATSSAAKVVQSRPSSAASNTSSDRKAINGRTESKASTKLKATTDSIAKLQKSRQTSTVSTKSKSAAASATKVVQSRPSSAASNSSSDRQAINGRTESKVSTKSKTTPDSITKLQKSRQASTVSTKSKSAAASATKVVQSRPSSAASNSSSDRQAINGRTESKVSTKSKTTPDSITKLQKSRQASTVSTKSKSAAASATKVVKSRPSSATSNSSSERKPINGRTESKVSTVSKSDSDSNDQIAQGRPTNAANKSRIPLPVPTEPKPKVPRSLVNVAAKVDCRRPMTAVLAVLPPNVKLVESKSRPQTSGAEEGRPRTSSKPTLVMQSSDQKRGPITLRLGSKTQCVESERVKVVYTPKKLSAASISQSSFENASLPVMKAKPSVPRSALTSTSCGGRPVDASSSRHSNDSKESTLKEPDPTLVSCKTNEPPGQAIKATRKNSLPADSVDSRTMKKQGDTVVAPSNLTDVADTSSSSTLKKPPNTSIFHICDEILNEEQLTPSAKAALLRMNREMIKAGKIKPTGGVRPTTAPQGSKTKLAKEKMDLNAEIEEVSIVAQPSKFSVKKGISLFNKLQDSGSVVVSTRPAKNGETTDDDYASLLELDSVMSCVGSQKMQTSITESMMEFGQQDALKLPRGLEEADEPVKPRGGNVSFG